MSEMLSARKQQRESMFFTVKEDVLETISVLYDCKYREYWRSYKTQINQAIKDLNDFYCKDFISIQFLQQLKIPQELLVIKDCHELQTKLETLEKQLLLESYDREVL